MGAKNSESTTSITSQGSETNRDGGLKRWDQIFQTLEAHDLTHDTADGRTERVLTRTGRFLGTVVVDEQHQIVIHLAEIRNPLASAFINVADKIIFTPGEFEEHTD